MKVPRDLLEHKTLIIALLNCATEVARDTGLDVAMPVAAMSRSLGANRTAVYQQQRRLLGALAALANARPGAARTWP